ncbi:VOC family protein [Streptomyces lonarensis]|uniref:VOC family protein n=1 Tax=Streptomyces lonarensis TaxID=700599 RepID=A0A7X6D2G1_9ACTN|nr:VOC family protein [Streptomyces lonarensis]
MALPIEDRVRSFAFYRDGLGFRAVGEPAADGVPEPLRFAVNDGLTLMLVPTGGFGWVLGGRETAAPGVSECVLGLDAASPSEVDALLARAEAAGAAVVSAPARQPWGYSGSFADPDGHLWLVEAPPEG